MSKFDFKAWYAVNADMLNTARKVRYRLDSDYRERVLETNRKSRQGSRESTLSERRNQRVLKTLQNVPAHRTFLFDGVEYKTIGFLAEFLGQGIQTVRAWERRGLIEVPSHTSPEGYRLYSLQEAQKIRQKLSASGMLDKRRAKPERRTLFMVRNKKTKKQQEMRLYSVAALAAACNRSVVAITNLEKRGTIPETPFRWGKHNKRLYSDQMIAIVREAFMETGGEIRVYGMQGAFAVVVSSSWKNLGVFDMEIVKDWVPPVFDDEA